MRKPEPLICSKCHQEVQSTRAGICGDCHRGYKLEDAGDRLTSLCTRLDKAEGQGRGVRLSPLEVTAVRRAMLEHYGLDTSVSAPEDDT